MHDIAIVAGTFDVLHDGHFMLIHTGMHSGTHVEMWVTDDEQAAEKGRKLGQTLQPYCVRTHTLAAWMDAQTPETIAEFFTRTTREHIDISAAADAVTAGADPAHPYRGRYSFHPLADGFGDTTKRAEYTAIVCSEETRRGCEVINDRRAAKGMRPLEIVVAPVLCDCAGNKLSSSQLRADAHAHARASGPCTATPAAAERQADGTSTRPS